uniref:TLDc domain-containing protein n=1 Tax=Leersia perrieri TaxID=77586 RepID=A0A0D9XQE7_9ORYZ
MAPSPPTRRPPPSTARFVTPRSLFNWGRTASPPPPEFQYHDVPPPFPMSLLSNTHLKGTQKKTPINHSNPLLLLDDQSISRELRCCYKATVDGFTATDFHRRCDFKGPCVIIASTTTALKFGGFSPEGYRSTDDYYDTLDAFLFYWSDFSDDQVVILPKVGGSGAALFDYARGGPQFGADGLLIGPPMTAVMGVFTGPDSSAGEGDLRRARSRLGLSYARRPDGKESLFGDEGKVELDEE